MMSPSLNALQAALGNYAGMVEACEAFNVEESEDEDDDSESEEEEHGGTSDIDDNLRVCKN